MISMKDVMNAIQKITAPTQRRVRLMVARAILELVDDSKKLQSLQISVRKDELRDDVERFQQFGFSSVPEAGAEAIVLHVGGGSDHPVVIAVDDRRYRPLDLAEGETCLYTIEDGKRVYCKSNGEVHLGADDENLGSDNWVALAKLVKDELSAIRETINNNNIIFNTMTLPSGMGPVGPPPVSMQDAGDIGEVKATKVKAK